MPLSHQSDAEASTAPPSRKFCWFSATFWTSVALAAGLLVTCIAWKHAENKAEHALRAEFDLQVYELKERIEQRLAYHHQTLLGTQALFASSKHVTHQEFANYVTALNVDKLYPGAQDFGIAVIVPREQKTRHLKSMQRQLPGYQIWPAGERPIYTAIVQQEVSPLKNKKAIGLDMYSNPIRRAAMEKARDSGKAAATAKVALMLINDEEDRSGFLIYLPFYHHGKSKETLEERRKHIAGWIYAPFRMNDLIAHLGLRHDNGIGISLYDSEEISPQTLLYTSANNLAAQATGNNTLTSRRSIIIADRQWTLVANAQPDFLVRARSEMPMFVAFIGFLLSIAIAAFTWMLATGRERAKTLAEKMMIELHESESRFRLMANAAPVMIWLSDVDHKHLWINDGWIEFTGHKENDWGGIWQNFVHPDDRTTLDSIHHSVIKKREPFQVEFRARRCDGVYRWIVDHGVPRFDENGQYMGYIGSSVDITERKLAEIELQIAAQVFRNSSESMCIGEYDEQNNMTIIAINHAYSVNSGYTSDEIIGRCLSDFLSKKHDVNYYDAIRQELVQHDHWAGEHWSRHKDGHHYPVWMNVTLVRTALGKPHRVVVLGRDLKKQKEAEELIRGLSASLITAREDEARRIAREIHDDLGQRLYWARLSTYLLPEMLHAEPAQLNETLERMRTSMDECLQIIRKIATQLRPPTLDMGFHVAVDALASDFQMQTGIKCLLRDQLDSAIVLSDETTINLYRIIQEALTNASRHAQASHIALTLWTAGNQVFLEIVDDGIGFDHLACIRTGSHGLTGMKERIAMLNGHIVISSELNHGTRINASVPLTCTTSQEAVNP